MNHINLSLLQFLWLNTRGGRGINDVVVKDNELYITSRWYGEDVLIGVPSDERIKKEFHILRRRNANWVLRRNFGYSD